MTDKLAKEIEAFEGCMQHRAILLRTCLCVTVPLWIQVWKLRVASWSDALVRERGSLLSTIVASQGDIIQFRGGKKGDTAAAFNALAEGVALLAYCPGGVTFLGDHWEAV